MKSPLAAFLVGLGLCTTASAQVTQRVSVTSAGTEGNGQSGGYISGQRGNSLSADGRFVAFESEAINLVPGDTNNSRDVFVRDRQSGTTERVSVDSAGVQAVGTSGSPSISANGRYVAFWSGADNLAPGDTNGFSDVFCARSSRRYDRARER
jgi:hypothetical protein